MKPFEYECLVITAIHVEIGGFEGNRWGMTWVATATRTFEVVETLDDNGCMPEIKYSAI